jgi:hypothetical protein
MNAILTTAPPDNVQLRRAIYAGSIFHLTSNATSRRLQNLLVAVIKEVLGSDYRHAQFRLEPEQHQLLMGKVQTLLYSVPEFSEAVKNVMIGMGFEPNENAFHPPRLRAVTDGGHNGPAPYLTYSAHRDTWYANSQSQINWWIPLHDVTQEETFTFFPSYFDQAIANSSGEFSYDDLKERSKTGKLHGGREVSYPIVTEAGPIRGGVLSFSCHAGDIILFSAAHLHETRKHSCGATRFSVDFRTVHLGDDAQGIGAPNTDNRSSGSALKEYIHPVASNQ